MRDQMVYNQKARLLDPGRTARMAALSRLLFLAFSFSRSLFRILFLDFSFSASLFCPLFLTFSFSPSRSRILFFAFSSSASLSRLLFLAFWHVPTLGKSGSRRRSCKLWCGRVDRNVRRCSAGASSSGDFFCSLNFPVRLLSCAQVCDGFRVSKTACADNGRSGLTISDHPRAVLLFKEVNKETCAFSGGLHGGNVSSRVQNSFFRQKVPFLGTALSDLFFNRTLSYVIVRCRTLSYFVFRSLSCLFSLFPGLRLVPS